MFTPTCSHILLEGFTFHFTEVRECIVITRGRLFMLPCRLDDAACAWSIGDLGKDIILNMGSETWAVLHRFILQLWDLRNSHKANVSEIPQWSPQFHAATLPQVQRLDCFTSPSCTKTVTRQARRRRDWCLKLNYIETRALCYRHLASLLSFMKVHTEKERFIFLVQSATIISRRKDLHYCVKYLLDNNKHCSEIIDEWFTMHLKASERRLCVEQCGLILWLRIFGS